MFKLKITAATRIIFVAALVAAWFVAVGAKLAKLQLSDQSRGESKERSKALVTSRGTIYDAKGTPMAISVPARSIFLDPQTISKKHKPLLPVLAGHIADVLKIPADEILAKLRHPTSAYQPLGIFIDLDDTFHVFTNKAVYSGIHQRPESVRIYPQDARMAHVVGVVNREHGPVRGVFGIEQRFEEALRGVPGSYTAWHDGRNREDATSRVNYIPSVPGANVYLTLDNNIQALLEEGLREAHEKWSATRAWGVIQDVHTGAILAMASTPAFDPNQPGAPWHGEMPSFENLPVCFNYEPGSTLKAFTLAIALEEGVIQPETTIDVGHGVWPYRGSQLVDKSTALRGPIGLPLIMQKSSNIASAKIALMLADPSRSIRNGSHRLHETYLRLFGFGRRGGIDLPAEETGILHAAERWDALTATRVGIGHSISVTAVQLVTAYSALANGGYLMKPHVVKRVVADNGAVLHEAKPEVVARPLSEKTSAVMRGLMTGVTQKGGTATQASIVDAGYTVAGKTGTSKMPIPGGYSSTDWWASFAGFCPAEKPVFAMVIVVEKPRGKHTGGEVAAPVFGAVARGVARYLCIPSDIDGEVVEFFTPSHFDTAPAEEDAEYWSE